MSIHFTKEEFAERKKKIVKETNDFKMVAKKLISENYNESRLNVPIHFQKRDNYQK